MLDAYPAHHVCKKTAEHCSDPIAACTADNIPSAAQRLQISELIVKAAKKAVSPCIPVPTNSGESNASRVLLHTPP